MPNIGMEVYSMPIDYVTDAYLDNLLIFIREGEILPAILSYDPSDQWLSDALWMSHILEGMVDQDHNLYSFQTTLFTCLIQVVR